MIVISAGGVVILGNTVLMLKKINGDWVLPKGRIEENETSEQAALREVKEETGIRCELVRYVGDTAYDFRGGWTSTEIIKKKVYWYLMAARSNHLVPQREEGFIEAKFIHFSKIEEFAKYEDEKEIIKKALVLHKETVG